MRVSIRYGNFLGQNGGAFIVHVTRLCEKIPTHVKTGPKLGIKASDD